MVVSSVCRDRVRCACGVIGCRRHIIGRQLLQNELVFRIDNAERRGPFGRRCGKGPERTSAAGCVIIAIASVEPNLVTGAHSVYVCFYYACLCVDDHILGRCSERAVRIPHIAGRIEDRIAADKQVLPRTDSQPGWAAIGSLRPNPPLARGLEGDRAQVPGQDAAASLPGSPGT